MNVVDSPLLRRVRHSHNATAGSPRAQSSGTFARSLKGDVVERSPFSKLTSSVHNAQTPVKMISTQSLNYSENVADSDSRASKPFMPPASSGRLSSTGMQSLQDSSDFSQARHSHHAPTFSILQNDDSLYLEGNSLEDHYPRISSGSIKELDVNVRDSAGRSHFPQETFKKEQDDVSSLQTDAELYLASHHPSITARSLKKGTSYRSATPYRHHSPAEQEEAEPSANQKNMDRRSSSQEISNYAGHSRSPFNASSSNEQVREDLSALMFKGATDLRSAKLEHEEKARIMQRLQEELDAVVAERNGLSTRIALVKEKTRDALESHAKKLSGVNNDLQSLRAQSQECFSSIRNARESMADVGELKAVVEKSMQKFEGLVGETGEFVPSQGWKSILGELRADMSNKQQVIDMLRDRLEFTQAELADAKNRVAELESTQTKNGSALQFTSERLCEAGNSVTELASLIRVRQKENIETLMRNAELEAELTSSLNETSTLKQRLSHKESELSAFVQAAGELEVHRRLLQDRDERIQSLQGNEDRLARTEELVKEKEARIDFFESSLNAKDKSIETLQRSLVLAEADAASQITLKQRLEEDLKASRVQTDVELKFREKIYEEKNNLKKNVETLIAEANDLKRELEEYKIKSRQSETRIEMLQERFEDQAMMLRMEKKSHGDIQERLLSVEAVHAQEIEETKQEAEGQIAQLKEHTTALEGLLQDRQADLNASTQENANKLSAVQVKHADHVRQIKEDLSRKTEEGIQLRKDFDAFRNEAQMPSQEHIKEVIRLKCKIEELEKLNEVKDQRARSIVSRYEQGDLSVEEQKLMDTAHRTSQTAQEQQLVAKGNEIRQRDNTIRALEKRKVELEAQLARVLNAQAKSKVQKTGGSLIDLDGWMPSQISSSVSDDKTNSKAPDRDRPTTMTDIEGGPDDIVATLCTPVAKIMARLPSDLSSPFPKSYQSTRDNVLPPVAPTFARLAEKTPDMPDDIYTFDDEVTLADVNATKRKRAPMEKAEKGRPLRRTRTATRAASGTAEESGLEAPANAAAIAPKVKARKRR